MNRKITALLLSLLLPVCAFSQPKTVLDIQLISNLPYVQAMVNGKGPYLFGFDSGMGSELLLDSTLAVELNITISGTVEMGDPSGRNNQTARQGTVKEFTLGAQSYKNITTVIANRKGRGMDQVVGIIGLPLFGQQSIVLNYAAQKFTIQNTHLDPKDKHVVSYTPYGGGVPGIHMQVGSQSLVAMVDTRSMSGGFKIPEQIIPKLHFDGTPVLKGKGRTVSNTIDINEVRIKEPISFAGHAFEQPVITYPSLSEEAIIGSAALKQFTIVFDPSRRLIQFNKADVVPNTTPVATNEYTGQYGERRVFTENGAMYLQRNTGMQLKMVLEKPDEYTLEGIPGTRIIFERNKEGKVTLLKSLQRDGHWDTSARD